MMAVAFLTAACWWGMAGCESTTSADSAMTVDPPSVDLTVSNRTQVFTAALTTTNTTLVLPLNWSVSNPALGTIKASQGVTAVYESAGNVGENTVTVRDQTGNSEAMALVRQL